MANLNLFQAVKNNDLDRIRSLIESCVVTNADVLEKDRSCMTVLHWASLKGHLGIVKLFVELIYSSNINNINDTGMSSNTNANTNILEKKDDIGWTALHMASFIGNLETVKYLVESGSDIEVADNKDRTAIDVAGSEEIKYFLTEQLEIQKNRYLLK